MQRTLIILLLILSCSILNAQNLRSFEENGKFGYKDKESKEIIIPAKYDDAYYYFNPEDKLVRVKLNGKYGYIDKTGKEVIALKYDDGAIIIPEDCVAEVSINNKWGLIDCEGNEITPLKFNWLSRFGDSVFDENRQRNDLFVAFTDEGNGVIDKSGKAILPFKYEGIIEYYNVPFLVSQKNKWGLVNLKGEEILPLKYNGYFPHSNLNGSGYESLKLNDKWGYMDSLGKIFIPFIYEQTYAFRGGLAAVEQKGKYGFIDISNRIIIPAKYDAIGPYDFNVGPAIVNVGAIVKSNTVKDGYVTEGGKWGYVDKTGKELTPFKYDEANSYKDGVAQVRLNNKVGLVDLSGKEVVPIIYDEIKGSLGSQLPGSKKYRFRVREVKKDGKPGYLDYITHEVVLPCIYDEIDEAYGIAVVKKDNKYGYYDVIAKKEIIPVKYDEAGKFYGWGNEDSKTATVKLNGREFKIDIHGNEVKK